MHGKIALEECWTIPEELENNNPAKFMPPGKGDNLTTNLLDIMDKDFNKWMRMAWS